MGRRTPQEGDRHDRGAWVVMVVAIALALLSWRLALEQDRRQAELRFRVAVDDMVETVSARMQGYEFALRAAGALFETSERVDRGEWKRFVDSLRLHDAMPGVQGLGFARALPPGDTSGFRDRVRAEGVEGFEIRPPPQGASGPVEMIEPLDSRNRRALGFDMYSDAVRRAAMDLARDTGQPAVSGPVRLVQEIDADVQPGFLMYVAVYRGGRPPSPAQRASSLIGWVFSPFRSGDLLRGLVPRDTPGVSFEVFDGSEPEPAARLFASAAEGDAVHRTTRTVDLPGRRWLLRISASDEFDRVARSNQPWLVAGVGALMNLALLLYVRSEARERHRATREAQRLAAEVEGRREAEQAMRASERRFREVVEASPTGLVMADPDGRILLANPQAERLFGYGSGELLNRSIEELVPEGMREAHGEHRDRFRQTPGRMTIASVQGRDLLGRRRDGTEFPVEVGLSPIEHGGEATVLASIVDLSARQAAQDLLASALREKTVLLDEVHHRVKNNLQVITSLLSLQARGAPPEAQSALTECRNRVHAMALTHQLLHENSDVTRLQVGEYLKRLARLLGDSHRGAAPGVVLRVEGTDVPLTLDLPRAIPCGLLVNELITNAYKHAFPGGGRGEIVVGIALEGETGETAVLSVTDDGVGLPDDPDAGRAGSLGFQLVPLLVDQLGAEMVRVIGEGTRFEVRFPARPVEPRRRAEPREEAA
ncbi:MAG TPA: CHASE domain-containing protein [Burkholderiaceae bacterium]|nr:CHASE domain-containing protein [Burkholderiaceae bacterium]